MQGASSNLVREVVRHAPDLVVAELTSANGAWFEACESSASGAPCPVLVFTTDSDAAHTERAVASGVHGWVVNGYGAQRLLQGAERLTASLETAGSVVPLRMLNMAGRQRILSQRFAKAALLGVLETADQPQHQADGEVARQVFEHGLAYLNGLPLSTPEIRRTLESAAQGWQRVVVGTDHVRRLAGRDRLMRLEGLAAASETLLDGFEQLSARYERSMQMLMG